jgi:hypothetical protein
LKIYDQGLYNPIDYITNRFFLVQCREAQANRQALSIFMQNKLLNVVELGSFEGVMYKPPPRSRGLSMVACKQTIHGVPFPFSQLKTFHHTQGNRASWFDIIRKWNEPEKDKLPIAEMKQLHDQVRKNNF